MATRKRSGTRSGKRRGRPPKRIETEAPPAATATTVEALIANASTDGTGSATALDELAVKLQEDVRQDVPVLTGEVHDAPGARRDSKTTEHYAQLVAGLTVLVFGSVALWRGPEWAVSEDEAGLVGDATAMSYEHELETLSATIKWLRPLGALLVVGGRKAMAEAERRKAEHEPAPRAPGLAPSDA